MKRLVLPMGYSYVLKRNMNLACCRCGRRIVKGEKVWNAYNRYGSKVYHASCFEAQRI